MEAIPSVVPPGMRDQLPVIFDSMRHVFVLSIQETFYVGALVCFVALGFSFLMQNPGGVPHIRGPPARDLPASSGGRLTDFYGQENGPPVEIRLEGKNALVTGASSGIGQGIAVALAAAGADVGINYRSMDGAEETSRRVRETGNRALVMQADVGDPVQVSTMFRRFDAEMGPIDILVANAGHGSTPSHSMRRPGTSGIGSLAPICTARSCAVARRRRMVDAGKGGRIVNISSVHEEACNIPTALLRGQGRSPQSHPFHGARAWASWHYRQRRGARDDPDADEPAALEDADYRADAGASFRSAALERLRISRPWWSSSARACVLLHRRDVSRRWRLDVELAAGLGRTSR